MSIALVVPVYNDLRNAEALCVEFLGHVREGVELVIVDNGSTHSEEFNRLKRLSSNRIRILRLEVNSGFGGGIQAGIREAKTDWVAWMPGNMKVRPSNLDSFLDELKDSNKEKIVKSLRMGRKPVSEMKTKLATVVQTVSTLTNMTDTGGTPTAIHRSSKLYKLALLGPKDYTFESYILYLANRIGIPILRVKVPYGERLYGNSHWQTGLKAEIALMWKIIVGIPEWNRIANHELRSEES